MTEKKDEEMPAAEGAELVAEPADEKMEEKKEPEKPKKVFDVEWTETVKDDKRKKLTWAPEVDVESAMLGLLVNNNLVSSMNYEGLQHLLYGARGTAGISKGRYMFEAKIADLTPGRDEPMEKGQWKTIRLGFGLETAGSLICGCDESSIGMDNSGTVWHEAQGQRLGAGRWNSEDIIAMCLNLDAASEHCNTFSVFQNGRRICPPVKIPEALKGKVLYPFVSLRQASVALNFGSPGARPLKELPFKARMLGDAANDDVKQNKVAPPKDGKYEIVLPIGMPNEGTFDFLDCSFYPKAKLTYTELSDRALVKQMLESGLRGFQSDPRSFKVSEFDSGKMMRAFKLIASASKKHIVIMSVKNNLLQQERVADLKLFHAPWFVTKAVVAMGPAPADFVKAVKAKVLDTMKAVVNKEVTEEKTKYEREKGMKTKKAEQDATLKNMGLEAKYKKDLAQWEKDKEAGKEGIGEKPTEPEKVLPAAVEMAEEPDWAKKMEVSEDEVKDITFRPRQPAGAPDTTGKSIIEDMPKEFVGRLFSKFTLPGSGALKEVADLRWLPEGEEAKVMEEGDPEGFSAVEFAWAPKAKAMEYISNFKKGRKVEDKYLELKPGPYCKEVLDKWSLKKVEMRRVLSDYQAAKKARAAAKLAKAKEEALATETNGDAAVKEEKKEEEKKDESKPEVDMTVDDDAPDVDVNSPEDVNNVDGKGTPLYKDFGPEDWLLAQLRFEMHHLVRSFAKDVTEVDKDRRGIVPGLLSHYYYVFFEKALHSSTYGQESMEALLEYVQDTVEVKDGVLALKSDADIPDTHIVRVTEEGRRDRVNRIAAGDESAKLKFARTAPTPAQPTTAKGTGKGYAPPGKGYAPSPAGKGYAGAAPYGKGYGAPAYGKGGYAPGPMGVKRPFTPGYGAPSPGGPAKFPRPTFAGKGK
jgi:hypothetical protein